MHCVYVCIATQRAAGKGTCPCGSLCGDAYTLVHVWACALTSSLITLTVSRVCHLRLTY